jgi:hypothetical protein
VKRAKYTDGYYFGLWAMECILERSKELGLSLEAVEQKASLSPGTLSALKGSPERMTLFQAGMVFGALSLGIGFGNANRVAALEAGLKQALRLPTLMYRAMSGDLLGRDTGSLWHQAEEAEYAIRSLLPEDRPPDEVSPNPCPGWIKLDEFRKKWAKAEDELVKVNEALDEFGIQHTPPGCTVAGAVAEAMGSLRKKIARLMADACPCVKAGMGVPTCPLHGGYTKKDGEIDDLKAKLREYEHKLRKIEAGVTPVPEGDIR